MRKITHEEVEACTGFYDAEINQVLKNGDSGYYVDPSGTIYIVQCCHECGEYNHTYLQTTDLLTITGIEPKHISSN